MTWAKLENLNQITSLAGRTNKRKSAVEDLVIISMRDDEFVYTERAFKENPDKQLSLESDGLNKMRRLDTIEREFGGIEDKDMDKLYHIKVFNQY